MGRQDPQADQGVRALRSDHLGPHPGARRGLFPEGVEGRRRADARHGLLARLHRSGRDRRDGRVGRPCPRGVHEGPVDAAGARRPDAGFHQPRQAPDRGAPSGEGRPRPAGFPDPGDGKQPRSGAGDSWLDLGRAHRVGGTWACRPALCPARRAGRRDRISPGPDPGAHGRRALPGAGGGRQVDRGPAFRELQRGQGERVLRLGAPRRGDHGAGQGSRPEGHLADLGHGLQEPRRPQPEEDRLRARGGDRLGGERPARGQQGPSERPADRHAHGRPPLGRVLHERPERRLQP